MTLEKGHCKWKQATNALSWAMAPSEREGVNSIYCVNLLLIWLWGLLWKMCQMLFRMSDVM